MNKKNILIVIPAYQEEESIQGIVEEIRSKDLQLPILIVDDGSADRTAQRAKEAGAFVVSLPFNIGVGGAVQTGFKFAVRRGFDIVVRLDADGQHDPSDIKDLIDALLNNGADLVIASRFLPPHLGYQSSFVRRIGIQFFSSLISAIIGLKVTDPTSGFRAYSKKTIELFAEDYPQDFPEPEEMVLARKNRAKILEVPVEMRARAAGRSSIRYLTTLYYMIKVTFAVFLSTLKKKKGGL